MVGTVEYSEESPYGVLRFTVLYVYGRHRLTECMFVRPEGTTVRDECMHQYLVLRYERGARAGGVEISRRIIHRKNMSN